MFPTQESRMHVTKDLLLGCFPCVGALVTSNICKELTSSLSPPHRSSSNRRTSSVRVSCSESALSFQVYTMSVRPSIFFMMALFLHLEESPFIIFLFGSSMHDVVGGFLSSSSSSSSFFYDFLFRGRARSFRACQQRGEGPELDSVDMLGEKQIGHRVSSCLFSFKVPGAELGSPTSAFHPTASFSTTLLHRLSLSLFPSDCRGSLRLSRPFIPNISRILTRLSSSSSSSSLFSSFSRSC